MTAIPGTGLGMLHSMEAGVLTNNVNSVTSDLCQLKHPLHSSPSALGTNQWLFSDILSYWERTDEKDHQLIGSALKPTPFML